MDSKQELNPCLILRFEIITEDSLDLNCKIPPLIIQPLLENAIKHGFKNIEYKGELKLKIRKENDLLVVHVMDNGSGIIANLKNPDHTSMSTNIITERLEIINKTYHTEQAQLKILKDSYNPKTKGTTIELFLPLISDTQ